MATLRELTAESIGRITRRGLESQIAQVERALTPRERPVAVAPGHSATAGVLVVLTDLHLILSAAAPFARPSLTSIPLADVTAAAAAADGDTWTLSVDHVHGQTAVTGMFDRDAQRFAALLT